MPTLRIAVLALLTVAASPPGGCDGAAAAGYQPCAGKACGDGCTVCPPDGADCFETPDVKACDRDGRCVSAGPLGCGPTDACAGKNCGDSCNICDTPVCETLVATGCDLSGRCVTATPSLCGDPCAGKKCGDSCTPWCGTGPCQTFAATACDLHGKCVTETPWLCYDPCAGKACGDGCNLCPPEATDCAEIMCMKACDAAGRCTCTGGGAACP